MADRRRWTPAEASKLVDLVSADFAFLFESLNPSKTKQMVDSRWAEITQKINSMGNGKVRLTVEQVTKKWIDLKSTAKMTVMKYRKGQRQTGGGENVAKTPSALQWKINSLLGTPATEGIPGTEFCDSSLSEPARVAIVAASSSQSPATTTQLEESASTPSPFLKKRPRKTPRQQQLEQNNELLKTENEMLDATVGIRDELQQTNSILSGILYEIKRSNDLKELELEQKGSMTPNTPELLPTRLYYNE